MSGCRTDLNTAQPSPALQLILVSVLHPNLISPTLFYFFPFPPLPPPLPHTYQLYKNFHQCPLLRALWSNSDDYGNFVSSCGY